MEVSKDPTFSIRSSSEAFHSPRLAAQDLPDDEIRQPDSNHLYGGGQAHGGSQGRLRHHEGDGRPHAGLEYRCVPMKMERRRASLFISPPRRAPVEKEDGFGANSQQRRSR